jgi:hypothetical protein
MTHKLQTRYCKCGCGSWWRCLPTSLSEYCSITHQFNIRQLADACALRHRDKSHAVRRARRKIKELSQEDKTSQEIADYLNENAYNPLIGKKAFTGDTIEVLTEKLDWDKD